MKKSYLLHPPTPSVMDDKFKSIKNCIRLVFSFLFVTALQQSSSAQCNIQANIAYKKDISCSDPTNGGIIKVKVTGLTSYLTGDWSYNISPNVNSFISTSYQEYASDDSLVLFFRRLPADNYTITIIDKKINNCEVVLTPTITKSNNELEAFYLFFHSSSSCGINNGSAEAVDIKGGVNPLTFEWSNGETTQKAINLAPGWQTVTVKDFNGCIKKDSVKISNIGIVINGNNVVYASSSTACDGAVNLNNGPVISGGTGPYSFKWLDNNSTSPVRNDLCASFNNGTYEIEIKDNTGCTDTSFLYVSSKMIFVDVYSNTIKYLSCIPGASNGEIDYNVTSSGAPLTPPYRIDLNFKDFTTQTFLNVVSTSGTLKGIKKGAIETFSFSDATSYGGVSGLKIAMSDSCDLVWPGDADDNGIANNFDVLPLGIAWGTSPTPPNRANPGNVWKGEGCEDAGKTFISNGKDYKFADCDGNGNINYADTVAIVQNYGLMHALKVAQLAGPNDPDLYYNIPSGNVNAGSTISIPIYYGSATKPVNSIYGIAFTIDYDPTIVDTSKLQMSFTSSWIGQGAVPLVYIRKNFGAYGKLDVGVVRTNQQNVSGYGQLGTLNIGMKDDIVPKLVGGQTLSQTLHLGFSNIKAIDANESDLLVNPKQDSIIVNITTGLKRIDNVNNLKIFPMPVRETVTLTVGDNKISTIQITNPIGQLVLEVNGNNQSTLTVDVQTLSKGVYFLIVNTNRGQSVEKIVVDK